MRSCLYCGHYRTCKDPRHRVQRPTLLPGHHRAGLRRGVLLLLLMLLLLLLLLLELLVLLGELPHRIQHMPLLGGDLVKDVPDLLL
eukprot:SAG22_NODE_1678_length_3827_cov_1.966202_2_plen_86_part_00